MARRKGEPKMIDISDTGDRYVNSTH
jgi:hypothetical protein